MEYELFVHKRIVSGDTEPPSDFPEIFQMEGQSYDLANG
jgi:hypothetical protein